MNYYNEFDPKAAAWLRELIKLKEIPDGEVDERSITDVTANDLRGFTQCHFFAGIGGWSLALQRAGIPSNRPLWTGSCPCQAFSCAGQQKGFEDERDLWPDFFNLIRECRPERVLGEQVKNAVKFGWLDRLYADLEGEGYACGSPILGAHSAGADHIRQRIYWMAYASKCGGGTPRKTGEHRSQRTDGSCGSRESNGLADASLERLDRRTGVSEQTRRGESEADGFVGGLENSSRVGRGGRDDGDTPGMRRTLQTEGPGGSGGVGDTGVQGRERHRRSEQIGIQAGRETQERRSPAPGEYDFNFWSDAVPHLCKDGKYRRFEPRVFPLVTSVPRGMGYSGDPRLPEYVNDTPEARVMRLKGYGNAICVETAAMFIRACDDVLDIRCNP